MDERLERVRVPTIAALRGPVVGGGAAIAAACDLRIAAPSARFGVPVARTLGNCFSMANLVRLSSLVGIARVKEIVFTARLVDADEALRIGLYNEVTKDEDCARPSRRRARRVDRVARAAHASGDEGGAAADPRPHAPGGERGPHPSLLHEPRLPRGRAGIHGEAETRVEGRVTALDVARRFQGDCGVPTPHQRARFDSVAGYFLGLDSDERPKLNAHMNNNPTWPKAFAFIGLTIMGLALAYYSTTIATAGVAGRILGTDRSGDVLTVGAAFVMVGVAMAAVFGFLALTQIRALGRRA